MHKLLLCAVCIDIVFAFVDGTTIRPRMDVIMCLTSVAVWKGSSFILKNEQRSWRLTAEMFLVGLVALLVFKSLWRSDTSSNVYQGPRWMGLWNNPNHYGLLMGRAPHSQSDCSPPSEPMDGTDGGEPGKGSCRLIGKFCAL